MLPFLTVALVCQLAGEVVVGLTGLPVPGPVVGMVLLLLGLAARRRPSPVVEAGADRLLSHLSLLFVPAGVGVVQYLALLRTEWLPVAASVVLGCLTTLVVTGVALRVLTRRPA